jgi:hypothetical protein
MLIADLNRALYLSGNIHGNKVLAECTILLETQRYHGYGPEANTSRVTNFILECDAEEPELDQWSRSSSYSDEVVGHNSKPVTEALSLSKLSNAIKDLQPPDGSVDW